MLTRQIDESPSTYALRSMSVVCRDCTTVFATSCLAALPPVTEYDTIEGDLHRVLPDAALRAALIAICPECGNAHWTVKLQRSGLNPEWLEEAPEIGYSKKFAVAVKTARAAEMDSLDIAHIAINGLYCAREAGEQADLWLELAAYEHSRGMQGDPFCAISGPDHLIMAEIWRQMGSFDRAIPQYQFALGDPDIPPEVIEYQITLARAGDSSHNALPPHLVRLLFPEAAAASAPPANSGKSGRAVPPHVARQPVHDERAQANGPPDRRLILSSAVKDDSHSSQPNYSLAAWSVEAIDDGSDIAEDDIEEAAVAQYSANNADQAPTGGNAATAQFNFEPQSSSATKGMAKVVPLNAIAGNSAFGVESQPVRERAFSNESSDHASRTKGNGNSSSDRVVRTKQHETIGEIMDADAAGEDFAATAATPINSDSNAGAQPATMNTEKTGEAANVTAASSDAAMNRKIDDFDLPLKVQQIIAVPQAASSVSLVQASQVYVAVATPPSSAAAATTSAKDAAAPTNMQSEQTRQELSPAPYMAPSPAQSRAARRAARAQQEQNPHDKFPEIQITDEEAAAFGYARYGYGSGNDYSRYEAEASAQVEAEPQYQSSGTDDYQQPVAQVAAPQQQQYSPSGQSEPTEYEQPAYAQYQQQPYANSADDAPQQSYAQSPRYELASAGDPEYDASSQYSAPSQQSTTGGAAATETKVDNQDGGDKDYTDAIARVEGFLSLTRLPSYQSWIRGYRK